ncbi:MAG: M42 family peptidase, partial [Oscillospiraceae bacterium]|nr:M42 family peptidase [Oscillospiraceae bacterium]
MDIKSTLQAITERIGVSGDEFSASRAAAELLGQYADNVEIDAFGNVTGIVRSRRENAKTLMLDAHIDQVGYIVTCINEQGFLNVGACGSPDVKTLSAQSVTVHGKKDVHGVISTLPPHVQKGNSAPEIGDISVDLGMSKREVEEIVSLVDRVTVDSAFRELCGGIVSAPAIDDR